ncbi:MAG TPA: hypothetical protein VMD30_07555 [Tepidisphaeraceae bacterium]|nr:hypothetical protein [Tepidisphaeraceae bacterium]
MASSTKSKRRARRKSPKRGASRDIAVMFLTPDGKTGTGIVKVRNAKLDKGFDRARDEDERKQISAAFDIAGFEALAEASAEETAAEWSKPY